MKLNRIIKKCDFRNGIFGHTCIKHTFSILDVVLLGVRFTPKYFKT